MPTAEIILTISAGAMVNFLHRNPHLPQSAAALKGLTRAQIEDLIEAKGQAGGRGIAQRLLRDIIRTAVRAPFDAPFYVRPEKSHRAIWLLHLSRHATARDVMIQCHWEHSNGSEHCGDGTLNILGWDAVVNLLGPRIFGFGPAERQHVERELRGLLPKEIGNLTTKRPITTGELYDNLANRTTLPLSAIHDLLKELQRAGEINIYSPKNTIRSPHTKASRQKNVAIIRDWCYPRIPWKVLSHR